MEECLQDTGRNLSVALAVVRLLCAYNKSHMIITNNGKMLEM